MRRSIIAAAAIVLAALVGCRGAGDSPEVSSVSAGKRLGSAKVSLVHVGDVQVVDDPIIVQSDTLYTVYENGSFVGSLLVGRLQNNYDPAQFTISSDDGSVTLDNCWAYFWGHRPILRTRRVVAAPPVLDPKAARAAKMTEVWVSELCQSARNVERIFRVDPADSQNYPAVSFFVKLDGNDPSRVELVNDRTFVSVVGQGGLSHLSNVTNIVDSDQATKDFVAYVDQLRSAAGLH